VSGKAYYFATDEASKITELEIMRHFKIIDNDLVANSRFGVEVMNGPRPIVLQLSKDIDWDEIEVDLELEFAKGNITGAEKQYLEFMHRL